LEGISFSILIGSWKIRRPLIGGKDFETSIGQGTRKGHGRFTKRVNGECFFGERRLEDEGGGVCERKLVPMCERRVSFYV